MQTYKVVGVMSGTSLDGVDLAYCHFHRENDQWSFEVKEAATVSYSNEWRKKLSTLHQKDALAFTTIHVEYGWYLGELVKQLATNLEVDFVSSHGHTIFHQPEKRLTVQIGEGASLSAACGYPTVCDFRTADIALGGQGAPLVPIGDRLLFSDYTYCLNLGGIANISFNSDGQQLAYDICPVNIVLNELAGQDGKSFDMNGEMAASGNVNKDLLDRLNALGHYSKSFPKSLGRENIEADFLPLINASEISIEDKLYTFCEHIAQQVSSSVKQSAKGSKMLVTGGGAFDAFLIERIQFHCHSTEIVLPEKTIIEFKEALIFAFLGVLRWRGENNCLKSVTGAIRDSCGGAVYMP
jgi:anhydro-N-acetylmuramic acid kinase